MLQGRVVALAPVVVSELLSDTTLRQEAELLIRLLPELAVVGAIGRMPVTCERSSFGRVLACAFRIP
jgi:hypothetical protein